jgi:hypothetical protein
LTCPLGSTFFGLTPEYRLSVFNNIHDIVYYGNGGFSWTEVYNMPIWLRKFTFNKIKETLQATAEANQQSTKSSKPKVARPNIKPNYSTKASE